MVGSYLSTKWFWISWMVRALFPHAASAHHHELILCHGASRDSVRGTVVVSCPTTYWSNRPSRWGQSQATKEQQAKAPGGV